MLDTLLSLIGLARGPYTRAHVIVMGRVFEGNFPVYAEKAARRRKIRGWMALKNPFTPNALIELEIEGPDVAVKDYIMDLRQGPLGTAISRVQVEIQPVERLTLGIFKRRA